VPRGRRGEARVPRPRLIFFAYDNPHALHSIVLQLVCALQGLELAVRTEDRVGLLSEITRVFRENSLSIIRAAISTEGGKAEDTFYVSDAYGDPVDGRTMDAVLRVKRDPPAKPASEVSVLGSLLKGSLQGFSLIRSYS
jgi:hypothetical protein